jgi:hypothetical protein
LVGLGLSSNKFTEFPIALAACPSLRGISLGMNNIESISSDVSSDHLSDCIEDSVATL